MNKLNLFIIITLLILTGCTTARIVNIDRAPIPEARSGELTTGEVGSAIFKAAKAVKWQPHSKKTGHIVATRNYRTHQAAVDILYSPKSYSIRYRSSVNLKYDGSSIHRTYNAWVSELTQAINAEIASAQYK